MTSSNDPIEIENIAQTIAKEIKQPFELCTNDHINRVALPPGWNMKEFDDESLLDSPIRIKGLATAHDADSFIEYIDRHSHTDHSTIYCMADYEKNSIVFIAIFNDHDRDCPQWQSHKLEYTTRLSVEYKNWIRNDGANMNQIEFALFLERNMDDIAIVEGMPTGSELLEMALQFEANQDMRLKSHVRLQSGGVQMQFVQDDDDATISRMTMFDRLAIGIPVFWNGDSYRIDARLRYRVREGKAAFWYELIRPDKVFEAASKTIIERIKAETGLPFFFGKWAS